MNLDVCGCRRELKRSHNPVIRAGKEERLVTWTSGSDWTAWHTDVPTKGTHEGCDWSILIETKGGGLPALCQILL